MLSISKPSESNKLRVTELSCDLAIAGGGLAGVCCAITAARAGLKVILIQDRPVLGGNSSSEVRLWALGATSHMGNNNRWAREGGVIDEILVENTYRNPEGNPVIYDTVLLEKVIEEPNITLLLNTVVYDLEKSNPDTIRSLTAFCPQNATRYQVSAPLFCDASGDGVVGFLAGAAFRMGAEGPEEFDERFAPSIEYGALMGHSIFFYSKDVGVPVKYVPPSFALKDITQIPRYRNFKKNEHGCQLWWIEYGGRLDTVHDSETIKWELWKIVYGVWDYIKNSGEFPEAETMTLEWVGTIPGKRESRRFEGDYILTQRDIIEQRRHADAVSYGGWAIDLHPADGIYSNKPGCDQWHSKGVYPIPYRCMYSRNINNLFLAGRLLSASHVACGSTRVMMTCAHNAQAVAVAAALCKRDSLMPRDLSQPGCIEQFQQELLKRGQYIPHLRLKDPEDLTRSALLSVSSRFRLQELPADGPWQPLKDARAMLIPVKAGKIPPMEFSVQASRSTELECQLRICSREGSFTPDTILETVRIAIRPEIVQGEVSAIGQQKNHQAVARGSENQQKVVTVSAADAEAIQIFKSASQKVSVCFSTEIQSDQYVFICLSANPEISIRTSETRVTGMMSLVLQSNPRVNTSQVQKPERDIGVDTMEFWIPQRYPAGRNLALRLDEPQNNWDMDNLVSGVNRPVGQSNAWVADPGDTQPVLTLSWLESKAIRRIELTFDTDADHPMESVLMGHPFNIMPGCVRSYRIYGGDGKCLYRREDNHQTRNIIRFDHPVHTDLLRIELDHPESGWPAALFEVRCYE